MSEGFVSYNGDDIGYTDGVTAEIIEAILEERQRQDRKHGDGKPQSHDDFEWLALTLEEVGEAAKALNDLFFMPRNEPQYAHRVHTLEREIIEAATMFVAWLHNRRRVRDIRQREVNELVEATVAFEY